MSKALGFDRPTQASKGKSPTLRLAKSPYSIDIASAEVVAVETCPSVLRAYPNNPAALRVMRAQAQCSEAM